MSDDIRATDEAKYQRLQGFDRAINMALEQVGSVIERLQLTNCPIVYLAPVLNLRVELRRIKMETEV